MIPPPASTKAVLGRLSERNVKSSTDIADSRFAAGRGSRAGAEFGRLQYRDDSQKLFESKARVLKGALATHEVVEVANPNKGSSPGPRVSEPAKSAEHLGIRPHLRRSPSCTMIGPWYDSTPAANEIDHHTREFLTLVFLEEMTRSLYGCVRLIASAGDRRLE